MSSCPRASGADRAAAPAPNAFPADGSPAGGSTAGGSPADGSPAGGFPAGGFPADASPLDAGPLAGIRRLSARETVRARIALAVEIGVLEPGERLPGSSAVAAALDVSEGTVRRALTSLCENGVLHRKRGRTGGTFVAENPRRGAVDSTAAYTRDAGTVRRLIDHRLLLECGAAHLAASRADPGEFDEMRRLVEAMDGAGSWAEFHELDARFHRQLAVHSGLDHACEELSGVLSQLHQYFLPYRLETLRESNGDHRALVDALTAADPGRAATVTHDHIAALKTTMFIGIDH